MHKNIRVLNKLARDKLHENLVPKGSKAITRILSDEEYKIALFNKLQEEVKEFLAEPISEELADVLEVVYALAPIIAGSKEALEKVRLEKAKVRGAFNDKLFVIEIHDKQ